MRNKKSSFRVPQQSIEDAYSLTPSSVSLGFPPERTLEYFGQVSSAQNERALERIKEHLVASPEQELFMIVTSPGGPSGAAMSFYDTVRFVLRPNLVTIGSGDVDSSGIIILLSGRKRYVTKHTTLLLHMAGRTFPNDKRFTAREIAAMVKEDRLKDTQYASILAEHSMLSHEFILSLMEKNTLLTPDDLVKYGFVEGILS